MPFVSKTLLNVFLALHMLMAETAFGAEASSSLHRYNNENPSAGSPKIGTILSTSLCHLDLHPSLKHFLTHPSGAQSYENVEVVFVAGHRPVLTILSKSDNTVQWEEVERVQLWVLQTDEEFHSLLQSKGFEQKTAEIESLERGKPPQIQGPFHHSAAKQVYSEAKSRGETLKESSLAAMDAFLHTTNGLQSHVQRVETLTEAIHRKLREFENSERAYKAKRTSEVA